MFSKLLLPLALLLSACSSLKGPHSDTLYDSYAEDQQLSGVSAYALDRCLQKPLVQRGPLEIRRQKLLPPGCAGQINLMLMVEDKKELFHGHQSDSFAYPGYRAAEQYMNPPPGGAGQ